MTIETIKPADVNDANVQSASQTDTSARLLGDIWAKPSAATVPRNDSTIKTGDFEAKDRTGVDDSSNGNNASTTDKTESGATETQESEDSSEKSKWTEELLADMVKDAGEGRLNDTARELLMRGLQANGMEGMIGIAQEINRRLAESGTDFRLSIVAQMNPTTKELTIGTVLTTPNESVPNILSDMAKNGENSQYKDRGFFIKATQSKPGIQI